MIEMFGMMVEEKEYKEMMETVKTLWEEEDKEDWEDFEEFAELPVLVCLLSLRLASLGVSGPAYLERHVLAFSHEVQDVRVIRVFVACVAAAFAGNFAIDFHGDSGVGDADGERVIQSFTMFEGMDKPQNP